MAVGQNCTAQLVAAAADRDNGASPGLQRPSAASSQHCLHSGSAGAAAALAWAYGPASATEGSAPPVHVPSPAPSPASELSAVVDLALRPLAHALCAMTAGVTSTWRPLFPPLLAAVRLPPACRRRPPFRTRRRCRR